MATTTDTCERCDSLLEAGDLRCAICGQATPKQTESRDRISVEVLRCQGCGAGMRYDVEVRAPRCAYCDSFMHLERIEDPQEQTQRFLPFTIEAGQAALAFRRWLQSLGSFRPSDLRAAARIESVKAIWWVAWAFDALALVSWTADSDFDSHRSDWAPHSGQAEIEFDDILVSASRGLSEEETDALEPYYDLSTAQPEPEGAEDAAVEQFEVQRSFARQRILASIDRMAIERITQRHVPGRRYRNVRVVSLLRGLITHRLALPAYVLTYRYRGRIYRAVTSGQRAYVVSGTAPYSTSKIAAAMAIGLAVLLTIVWMISM